MTAGRPLAVVLCRPPGAPDSKTRLAREVGRQRADAYYLGCLRAVVGTLAATGADLRFAVAGRPLALAAVCAEQAPDADLVRQVGDTFAERQAHEIARGLADRYEQVVLCASDLPELPAAAVEWAVAAARRGELGLVPSHDGGYSLLSSSRPVPELSAVPMSRPDTADRLAATLAPAGHRVAVADFAVRDLDVLEDLTAAGTGDPATAGPLISIGLPGLPGGRAPADQHRSTRPGTGGPR